MVGRPLTRKTREEKREESRRLILDTAMDLFFEKGYDQTTTRDILLRTGILNGSLYNRFKSKEEILLAIVSETLDDILCAPETKDPLGSRASAFAFPSAILVYISSHSRRAAELIYSAGRSAAAVEMYLEFYRRWYLRVFGPGVTPWDDPVSQMKTSALVGAVGNVCGRYASGLDVPFEKTFEVLARMAVSISPVPVGDASVICGEVTTLLRSMDVSLRGRHLSELPDYR